MKCFDPQESRVLNLGGKEYLLNDKFYVRNFSDWDERLRDRLALQENIALSEEHCFAIDCLRDYYSRLKVHPVIRTITSELQKRYGAEKGSLKYFHTLFPGGIHQAFLIAGLPMVDSCC